MATLSPPPTAQLQERSGTRLHDLTALTGALFVLGAAGAFLIGGNTPDGDASPDAVIAYYTANRTQGIIAAVILALTAIPTLAFTATQKRTGLSRG